jgi:glycosyltransferase involved in cell wall biosynthesis
MKLLFITQIVDKNDLVQGIYHEWISELANEYEHVTVMCLFKGAYTLPHNVTVYSLQKEVYGDRWYARALYLFRFYTYILTQHRSYDRVLVHMNEEYVLLGKPLWALLRKRVSMWRNHYAGSVRTWLASMFSDTVFYTSRHSYTARFAHGVRMPVGVDTRRFHTDHTVLRPRKSILFLSRMAPSKRPHVLIEALGLLHKKGIAFTATLCGPTSPTDMDYMDSLTKRVSELGIQEQVVFLSGVPNHETVRLYQAHEYVVNCSPSGMFDKTMFEAAACGALVLASSDDFSAETDGRSLFAFDDPTSLSERLAYYLQHSSDHALKYREVLSRVVSRHSLQVLVKELSVRV